MKLRTLLSLSLAFTLLGCASPAQFNDFMNAVSDPIVVKTETFDGSTSVLMRERAFPVISSGDATMPYGLSANWNSKQAQQVRLQFLASFEARSGGAATSSPLSKQWEPANAITEIQINADGKLLSWKPRGFNPSIMSNPKALSEAMGDIGIVLVTIEQLKQVTQAKDLKMRIKTTGAVLDRDIDFAIKRELLGKELVSSVLPRYVDKIQEIMSKSAPNQNHLSDITQKNPSTTHLVTTTQNLTPTKSVAHNPEHEIITQVANPNLPCDEDDEWKKVQDAKSISAKMAPYQNKRPTSYLCKHILPIDKKLQPINSDSVLKASTGKGIIELQIAGEFRGWASGGEATKLTLTNGEVWQQGEYTAPADTNNSINQRVTLRTQRYQGGKTHYLMKVFGSNQREIKVYKVK